MKALDDPEFFDYIKKFSQSIQELYLISANEIGWSFGGSAFHNMCQLAALGFQVSYTIESIPTTNTSVLINGHYNGKVLAVRFYNQIEIIDIASSERLPGATKHYEDTGFTNQGQPTDKATTYFVKAFRAKDCLNASLYLEKLISKTMGHNVNLRYR